MLFLVSTPIGNLQDITLRALSSLKSCDYILCEDTRHSAKLLQAHGITTALVSYHRFNERKRQDAIIHDLLSGKHIALISDAGTPVIADPGFTLVQECHNAKIPVTAIPGPSALICALTLSGVSTTPFQFVGFLPKKESELKKTLDAIVDYPGTTCAYESPHRVKETLTALAKIAPQAKVTLCRELTKQYETILSATAEDLLTSIQEIKGEIVLIIEAVKRTTSHTFSPKLVQALVADLVAQGSTTKEAIYTVSHTLRMAKNTVYEIVHLALDD